MTQESSERRQLYALRSHIDTLLAAGASLEGRDPVRLSLDGQILIVRHGMLVSENSYWTSSRPFQTQNGQAKTSATRPSKCAFITWLKRSTKPN